MQRRRHGGVCGLQYTCCPLVEKQQHLSLHALLLKGVWSLVKQQAAYCQAQRHFIMWRGQLLMAVKRAQYSSNVKNKAIKKPIPRSKRRAEPFQKQYLSPIRTQFKKKEQIGAQNLQRLFSSTCEENDTFSMC